MAEADRKPSVGDTVSTEEEYAALPIGTLLSDGLAGRNPGYVRTYLDWVSLVSPGTRIEDHDMVLLPRVVLYLPTESAPEATDA